jgi:epoxyqueuosine reductase QueG
MKIVIASLKKPSANCLNEKVSSFMYSLSVDHLGFADLRTACAEIREYYGDKWDSYPYAVSFGVNIPSPVADEILTAPSHTYLYYYNAINIKIDQGALALTSLLVKMGFKAYPIPASQRTGEKLSSIFSHRLAASLAGLGWIGKSCSLITLSNGPRIRLGTVLTDAPFECGRALSSRCGNCTVCFDKCPAKAIKGRVYSLGEPLEKRLDAVACDEYLQAARRSFGKRACGICMAVCPYGLNSAD